MIKELSIYNKQKLISIIVPIYNVEKYLERCLDSILLQTYSNYELILVNDGSTDSSKSIVSKYLGDSRIIFIDQENVGLSGARNRGLREAKGDFVTFIDSDDWISPDYLENMIVCMLKENADLVSMRYCQIKDKKRKMTRRHYVVIDNACADSLFCCKENNYAWGKLIKLSILENNNIYFPLGRNYEDIGTMYKIYDICNKVVLSDKGVYYYRIRDNSITSRRTVKDVGDKIFFLDEMKHYQLTRKYKYLEFYILVKAFGAMADLYKIPNLNINRKKEYQKKIYELCSQSKLLYLKLVPVNAYIRAVCMQMRIAHILLIAKYGVLLKSRPMDRK